MSLNRFGLTGNHITIIAVTTILAVTSGSVWSVSAYTNVALQDPVNGKKAAIDATRQTLVKDTRASTDLLQANYVSFWKSPVPAQCVQIAAPPAGKSMVVKTITANTFDAPTTGAGRYIFFFRNSTGCTGHVASINPPGVGLQNVSLDPGIVVAAGEKLWVRSATGVYAEVYGTGYLIPSAWGPPSGPVSAVEPASATQQTRSGLGNGG